MATAVANAVQQRTFDQFTGRCRLPVDFMQHHGLFNGAAVIVFSGAACFLCKAHATRPPATVSFDASISLEPTHMLVASLEKHRVHGDLYVSIPRGGLKAAASISLEPTNEQAATADINALLQGTHLRLLQDACRRLVLHESCIVRLPHPQEGPTMSPQAALTFRVHRTLPAGLVRVVRATRVNLFRHEGHVADDDVERMGPVVPSLLHHHATPPIGGLADELKKLEELIYMTVAFPDIHAKTGIHLPKGVLLSGPPGVGKTLLVRTATQRCHDSGTCELALRVINGAEILSGGIGEAEAALRDIFAEGRRFSSQSPRHVFCLFLDELDALCPQREQSGRSHSRIVAQLLTLMDGIDDGEKRMIVVGATNLPNSIDPALRRPGRFDREVMLRPPSVHDRAEIFKIHLARLPLDKRLVPLEDLALELAQKCVGFVGADIAGLCRQACIVTLTRLQNADTPRILKFLRNQQLSAMYWNTQNSAQDDFDISHALSVLSIENDQSVTADDFTSAMEFVQASALRGANTFRKDESGKTTWNDIGGLESVKISLQQAPTRGILLYGPPGCSKSTIVRACAYASQATFLSLSAAQVFSPYFGDAEAAIRQIFRDARAASPAIVFMDEIDAIVPKREFEQGGSGGWGMALRVLSTLLNEMDGVETADGLLVIGATNRPDMIDAALLRPGRFDRIVYVPLPELEDRFKILTIHTKNAKLAVDVDLRWIATQTQQFSGAELENVCREAALIALRENIHTQELQMHHFKEALQHASPVSTNESLNVFKQFQSKQESGR
ncbi:Aste57867_9973 [Aphanomyces stellatus]|uniref:Aste57867_9973 protein n=1 Tax=Aphanomyces stellatus TaxID=120398 RepID=A0A485KPJ0_9STRA|nr:hypothetical protein As57867_009934 [Aphanomyces stellatus]VFT86851.1 Aste57867_9973 [Aphanomyces stellatus]